MGKPRILLGFVLALAIAGATLAERTSTSWAPSGHEGPPDRSTAVLRAAPVDEPVPDTSGEATDLAALQRPFSLRADDAEIDEATGLSG